MEYIKLFEEFTKKKNVDKDDVDDEKSSTEQVIGVSTNKTTTNDPIGGLSAPTDIVSTGKKQVG